MLKLVKVDRVVDVERGQEGEDIGLDRADQHFQRQHAGDEHEREQADQRPEAAGVGYVFGSFLQSALRNPAAADSQQGRLFIGFAAAELLGLIAFAVAMIILYAR